MTGRSHERRYAAVFIRSHVDRAAGKATMRVNARVHIAPNELQAIVEGALRVAARERVDVTIVALGQLPSGQPKAERIGWRQRKIGSQPFGFKR